MIIIPQTDNPIDFVNNFKLKNSINFIPTKASMYGNFRVTEQNGKKNEALIRVTCWRKAKKFLANLREISLLRKA